MRGCETVVCSFAVAAIIACSQPRGRAPVEPEPASTVMLQEPVVERRPTPDAKLRTVSVELALEEIRTTIGVQVDAWFVAPIFYIHVRNVTGDQILVHWAGSTIELTSGKLLGPLVTAAGEETLMGNDEDVHIEATPAALLSLRDDELAWSALDGATLAVSIWKPRAEPSVWTAKIKRTFGPQPFASTEESIPFIGVKPKPARKPTKLPAGPAGTSSRTPASTGGGGGCVRGCRCGNSCISCAKRCRK